MDKHIIYSIGEFHEKMAIKLKSLKNNLNHHEVEEEDDEEEQMISLPHNDLIRGNKEENKKKINENNKEKEEEEEMIHKKKIPLITTPYDNSLDSYCNWHRDHPHATTPRKLRATGDFNVQVCEEFPSLAYIQNKQKGYYKINEPSKDFLPNNTGQNATFKEVTETAHSLEHQLRLEKREDYYDPWWMHSVKVQSNIFHLKDINKNNIYKEEYSENELLNETLQQLNKKKKEREQKLREREEELAMSASWGKPNRHIKTARQNKILQSRYTIHGKEELSDYQTDRFEQNVEIALNEYYLSDSNPFISSSPSSFPSSTRKSKRTFISTQLKSLEKKQFQQLNDKEEDEEEESQVENDLKSLQEMSSIDKKLLSSSKSQIISKSNKPQSYALLQQQYYEDYKIALGGEKEIQKITDKLVKYSKKINKENNQSEFLSILSREMDFLDACLHLNAIQVICLLKFGADANTITDEDEPVFFLIFQKVITVKSSIFMLLKIVFFSFIPVLFFLGDAY